MQTMQQQLRTMVGEIMTASASVRSGASEIASGNLNLLSYRGAGFRATGDRGQHGTADGDGEAQRR